MFKIVSFNINGIRARPHQLAALRAAHDPDVVGLQECKVADESFPFEMTGALGFVSHAHGQKGHYGVALLSRHEPVWIQRGLPGEGPEAQRRLIAGDYARPDGGTIRVVNGYFPQGEGRAHPTKFPDKQRFYADLLEWLRASCSPDQPLVLLGDMNVAPRDPDVGIGPENARRWLRTGKCGFLPEERAWFQALLDWGLTDAYRLLHPEVDDVFSWFDYRSRGFEQNPRRGLRIDHLLITAPLRDRLRAVGVDDAIRGMDQPSDHCPVWACFAEASEPARSDASRSP